MYTMSREIGIDAGHRVPTHGSKCRHLHGHRYTIQAICQSEALHDSGEQKDMTLDFGFLKELMITEIDEPCDHGLILWWGDELFEIFFTEEQGNSIADAVRRFGYTSIKGTPGREWMKFYIIPQVPTAEVLARHWFYRLEGRVSERSSRLATLQAVKVHETPNCWATYTKEGEESNAAR